MHFTLSNLLHDFSNGKYMLFYLYIYIYISCEKYRSTRPDSQSDWPEPVLTCNSFDLTQPDPPILPCLSLNFFVWSPNYDMFVAVFKGHYKLTPEEFFRESRVHLVPPIVDLEFLYQNSLKSSIGNILWRNSRSDIVEVAAITSH